MFEALNNSGLQKLIDTEYWSLGDETGVSKGTEGAFEDFKGQFNN